MCINATHGQNTASANAQFDHALPGIMKFILIIRFPTDDEALDTDSSDTPQRAPGGQPKVVMAPEAAVDEGSEVADDDDATVEVRGPSLKRLGLLTSLYPLLCNAADCCICLMKQTHAHVDHI